VIGLDFSFVFEGAQQYTTIYPLVTVYVQSTFSVSTEVGSAYGFTALDPKPANRMLSGSGLSLFPYLLVLATMLD